MRRSFHSFVVLSLCGAFVWSSGGAAEAFGLCAVETAVRAQAMPHLVVAPQDPSFFTEQVIVERLVSALHVPRRVSLGYLRLQYGILSPLQRTVVSSILFMGILSA